MRGRLERRDGGKARENVGMKRSGKGREEKKEKGD